MEERTIKLQKKKCLEEHLTKIFYKLKNGRTYYNNIRKKISGRTNNGVMYFIN